MKESIALQCDQNMQLGSTVCARNSREGCSLVSKLIIRKGFIKNVFVLLYSIFVEIYCSTTHSQLLATGMSLLLLLLLSWGRVFSLVSVVVVSEESSVGLVWMCRLVLVNCHIPVPSTVTSRWLKIYMSPFVSLNIFCYARIL